MLTSLYNLRDSFTSRLGFEVAENENVRIHVFSDNSQAINFAARLNTLIHRITDILGNPLASAFTILRNGDDAAFNRQVDALDTEENRQEMNNINNEINQLTGELNGIPERKPTEEDFNAGRCVDSGLDDL